MSYATYDFYISVITLLGWSAFVAFLWLVVLCVCIIIYQDVTKKNPASPKKELKGSDKTND